MRHTITTTILNTPSGTPTSSDGVMMLVIQGVAASTGTRPLVLDTAYLGSSLDDFVTGLGITVDYDYVNGLNVYQQIKEFYDEAGDGAYLWLVVTETTTAYATWCDSDGTTFMNLIRGTILTDPAMRVKMVGFCYKPPESTQDATDFNADALAAIPILQAQAVAMGSEGFPFSVIIDGANMQNGATTDTIQTMANKAAPAVSFCITGSIPNGTSAVGAALGRFARITVGHGFGATEDGSISLSSSFLTDGVISLLKATPISQGTSLTAGHTYMVLVGPVTYNGGLYSFGDVFTATAGTLVFTGTGTTVCDCADDVTISDSTKHYVVAGPVTSNGVEYITGAVFTSTTTTFNGGFCSELSSTDITKLFKSDFNNLGDKQYMFYGPFYQLPGLYWNDGATCDAANDPLSTQEFNRVGNKMVSALLNFLALLKGKNVPIDTKTGLVSLAFTSAKQGDFYDTYIKPLIVSQDISGGSLSLTGTPNGVNVVNWTYTLTINGTPISGSATGTVVFSNS